MTPITNDKILNETKKQLRLQLALSSTSKHSDHINNSIFHEYRDQITQLEDLMTRTLKVGESNSCLLVAPRGAGKSTVINVILERLKNEKTLMEGTVVKLSGLLQTDDRLALKEITQQLRLESEAAGKVFNNFAENLTFLLESLKSGSKETTKSVIFILDEFDLFCHHKNQTLLYNLFDVAQSAQAPICVIGLTSRLDVIELLEKRVKSRFSHRQIHLFPSHNFDDYIDVVKSLLYLVKNNKMSKSHVDAWNRNIDLLIEDEQVISILSKLHAIRNDVRSLKTLLLLVVSKLSTNKSELTPDMFVSASKILSTDAKSNILRGLSILQLCLIVAMKHLAVIYEGQPFNFEMVYREYSKFCQKRTSVQSFERPVVFKAYDQLLCLEILRRIDNVKGVQREYRLVQLMITPSDIVETISQMPAIPTDLCQWLSSNYAM